MADVAHGPRESEPKPASGSGDSFALPLFAIVLVAAGVAGAAGHLLAGAAGWAATVVVALFGGVVAGVASRGGSGGGDSRARLLTNALRPDQVMNPKVPTGWAPAWADLYERLAEISQESKMSEQARSELERTRRQAELAIKVLREGKDPLIEIAELRVGPLRELLEVAREGVASGPVVNRIPLGEEELVGTDGEPLPEPWPKGVADHPIALDPRVQADTRRGLDELIDGLTRMSETLAGAGNASVSVEGGARTPAQLVDAVVHTAADGIEDLAAGLMRANELAAVAERVTNKATLLALNAALEATRSGSEAFAAIAEETRRLAEFAREATDTIARLSSEIEYKVGETITAIHATSEDAKSAVAALPSGLGSGGPAKPSVSPKAVETLLRRARALRDGLGAPAGADASGHVTPDDPPSRDHDATPPAPSGGVSLFPDASESAAVAAPDDGAPRRREEGTPPASRREDAPALAPPTNQAIDGPRIPLLDGLMPGSSFDQ